MLPPAHLTPALRLGHGDAALNRSISEPPPQPPCRSPLSRRHQRGSQPCAAPSPPCPVSPQGCAAELWGGKRCDFMARLSLRSGPPPCHAAPADRAWRHGHRALVASPSLHAAPQEPGEMLPLQSVPCFGTGVQRDPSKGCPEVPPVTAQPRGPAARAHSSPSGTSPPSRTERFVATPSPAKKRTTSVSTTGSGAGLGVRRRGGRPCPRQQRAQAVSPSTG